MALHIYDDAGQASTETYHTFENLRRAFSAALALSDHELCGLAGETRSIINHYSRELARRLRDVKEGRQA
jgi:hypothetical protein